MNDENSDTAMITHLKESNKTSYDPDTVPFSSALCKCLFESCPTGIIVIDEDHRIVNMNPKSLEMFGDSEELTGQSLYELCLSLHDANLLKEHIDFGEATEVEIFFIKSNYISFQVRVHPVHLENQTILFIEDYVEKRILKKELSFFKETIRNINDGICMFDDKGVIFYCNPVFIHQIGDSLDKILGTNIREYWITKEEYEDSRLWISIQLAKSCVDEIYCNRYNDDCFLAEVQIDPIMNDNHKLDGFICVQRYIGQCHKDSNGDTARI